MQGANVLARHLEYQTSEYAGQTRFDKVLEDPEANAALLAIARNVYSPAGTAKKHTDVAAEKMHTIGAWGEAAPAVSRVAPML